MHHSYVMTTRSLRRDAPPWCRGVKLLNQDESRHIAYGVYLILRCLAAHPDL